MAPWLSLAVLVAGGPDTSLSKFVPCEVGLTIEYVVTDGGKKTATVVETVVGPGRERNTCVLDKRAKFEGGQESRDVWAREILSDRVANAGWVDTPLAFRPILLQAPIKAGARWAFDETKYRIARAGHTVTVPAGKLENCVEVVETAAGHHASTTYCAGVGVALWSSGSQKMAATAIRRGPKQAPPKR